MDIHKNHAGEYSSLQVLERYYELQIHKIHTRMHQLEHACGNCGEILVDFVGDIPKECPECRQEG
jgi:hypothetical protein